MVYVSLPIITSTQSAGPAVDRDDTTFDDLAKVGGWPAAQNIQGIQEIEIWATNRVTGLRVTYSTTSGPQVLLHGNMDGVRHNINIPRSTLVTGVYGGQDGSGNILNLSVVLFDTIGGRAFVEGPYGNPANPPTHFGTFGTIRAFLGSTSGPGYLKSLGFWKIDTQTPALE